MVKRRNNEEILEALVKLNLERFAEWTKKTRSKKWKILKIYRGNINEFNKFHSFTIQYFLETLWGIQ
jgi:hypothetical protein